MTAVPTPLPIDVLPPSRRGETAAVLRAAVAIVVIALLWIGSVRSRGRADGANPANALLPYQLRFAELDSSHQRTLRELQEGALEILRMRGQAGSSGSSGAAGAWPDVARLASDGVPPFADDGVDRGRRRWTSRKASHVMQYLGLPMRQDGARALLLQVLEPRPGDLEGRDPRTALLRDEQHRRLPDGTLLHVSFWIESAGVRPTSDELVQDPALEGWTQVLSGVASAAAGAPPETEANTRTNAR